MSLDPEKKYRIDKPTGAAQLGQSGLPPAYVVTVGGRTERFAWRKGLRISGSVEPPGSAKKGVIHQSIAEALYDNDQLTEVN